MLRSSVAALRAVSSSSAALQRSQRAVTSQVLVSAHASVRLQSVVSSVRPSAAFSVLPAGAARLSSAAASAALPNEEFPLFVTKEGDKTWAEVTAKRTMSVSRLIKEVAKELGLTARVTTLTLYASDKDGKTKPGQKPLDSTETLVEALPNAAQSDGKHFLIIKEATAPGSSGEPPACAVLHTSTYHTFAEC